MNPWTFHKDKSHNAMKEEEGNMAELDQIT